MRSKRRTRRHPPNPTTHRKQQGPTKKPATVTTSANTCRVDRVPTSIMLSDSAATAITGAAFGASLAASGVYLPSVIIDQFRLTDFHMFHVFATAVGSSA
jgi:hypothetical protein